MGALAIIGIVAAVVIVLIPAVLAVWLAIGVKRSMNRNDRGRK